MNQKRDHQPRKVLGMTGRQLGVLVILAILLLLVILLALAFTLGTFDGSLPSLLPTKPPTPTTGEEKGTPLADAPLPKVSLLTPSPLASQGTGTPSVTPTVTPTLDTTTTATQTATPSPTRTPPAEVCDEIELRFQSATSSSASWQLQNHSGTVITLVRIEIDWPKSNDAIFNAILNGKTIWSDEDLTPPTIMTTWIGDPGDRSIDRLSRVEFFFGTMAAPGGYDLYLWFDNGCEVSASN